MDLEEKILAYKGKELPDGLLIQAKKDGFADRYLARLLGRSEDDVRTAGLSWAWCTGMTRCR